ncbi:hypothetical protein LFL96_04845 [Paraburkholderia sp. D15]|uniref:hypothetical protein n=1 Tax=Paraburkholderia sp. D15 TaxID=2880218 RepID=UPI00247A3EBB|nr:hypothetical protein [Paraburkholderia sp. D15]WGS51751.1 hypothetical protein LFL96_04845 [Paraburkholderia sp. D15]
MTCRYSETEWLDVLYASVRNTPGGVADAANFLTLRRGKNIATESLRLRLRGEGDNRLSMEMFELLIEWMEEKRQPHYLDPIHALSERFGLIAERQGDALSDEVDSSHDVNALARATLDLQVHVGEVAGEVVRAVADRRIDLHEVEQLTVVSRKGQRLFQRLIYTATRLAKLRRK